MLTGSRFIVTLCNRCRTDELPWESSQPSRGRLYRRERACAAALLLGKDFLAIPSIPAAKTYELSNRLYAARVRSTFLVGRANKAKKQNVLRHGGGLHADQAPVRVAAQQDSAHRGPRRHSAGTGRGGWRRRRCH